MLSKFRNTTDLVVEWFNRYILIEISFDITTYTKLCRYYLFNDTKSILMIIIIDNLHGR